MVAGQVKPPRLDLANEDLVRAHVHAVWLAETGVSLGALARRRPRRSTATTRRFPLRESIVEQASRRRRDRSARDRAPSGCSRRIAGARRGRVVHAELARRGAATRRRSRFDRACDRWRELYRAAIEHARDARTRSSPTHSRRRRERERAPSGCAREAEARSSCCAAATRRTHLQSDFYSYRYFASEGFLPGYSFPRLPLSAFIPAPARPQGQGRVPVSARASSRSPSSGRAASSTTRAPATSSTGSSCRSSATRTNRLPTTVGQAVLELRLPAPGRRRRPGLDLCEQLRRAARPADHATSSGSRTSPPSGATGSTPTRRSGSGRASRSRPASASPSRDGRGRTRRARRGRRRRRGEAHLRRRRDALADQPRLDAAQEPERARLRARHRARLLGRRTSRRPSTTRTTR